MRTSLQPYPSLSAVSRPAPATAPLYPPAYEALRPFFDPGTQWGHSCQEHLAYRSLSDQFPQLSAQERLLVVLTARRLFHGSGGA